MPCLHSLQIGNCNKLKGFPQGFTHLTSLQILELKGMSDDLERNIQRVDGEDPCKLQQISEVWIDAQRLVK
ncbi:hypothetical protein AMTR_s00061p00163950 [Amborella trichopoda]|uniref:Rx N-terminal domain-containing protein n=1 Tax=Amborella trichopoda TaxID=13333 RepID=U5D0M6_AMBTC|nr:hypothetical protein AMTR_s00061p00163950 [Amborella trichopoda]